MRVSVLGLIIVGMLLLVTCAGAAVPDHMTISGDDWMIADGMSTSPVTVTVLDTGGTPVAGATLTFQILSPWTLSPSTGMTGSDGKFTTILNPTTKSGTAEVAVNASITEGNQVFTIRDRYLQKIDHATPMNATPLYQSSVTVGSIIPVSVILSDIHLNPCDNRRETELVKFTGSSPSPALWDGTQFVDTLTVPCNESGKAVVWFRVDRVGPNYLVVEPPAPISPRTIPITGVADGFPVGIQTSVVPAGTPYPSVLADGSSSFVFTYALYDQYGFPSGNRRIDISTSLPGEETQITTNSEGIVEFRYGPKHTVGPFTITATSADNPRVSTSQTVEFVSGAPVAMLLTASPQSMASRDWSDTIVSTVSAKVVDVKGNPVRGEPVTFRMTQVNIGGYVQTRPPAIELGGSYVENLDTDLTATTGDDGIARLTFHPGAFTTDRRAPGWSSKATGTAIVQATWNGVPKTIMLGWKNYPYLSVETSVPPTVVRDGKAEIMVRIRGDGWALQPDPIDVILATDRSGSMLYDDPDRMYSIREGAKVFVDQMTGQDEVGLVSFGRSGYIQRPGYNSGIPWSEVDNSYFYPTTYPDYATLDRPLGRDYANVKQDLDRMVPDHGTPMRKGLKVAIDELIARRRAESVAAVVLLTDGDYNWFGDPLARGTGTTSTNMNSYSDLTSLYYLFSDISGSGKFSNQNMSRYASSHGIRIYTIAYGSSISSGGKSTLSLLANTSGGKYFEASASNIADVYTAIAGELHTEAGVGTVMDLDFNNVEVNSQPFAAPDVFRYEYIPGTSTHIYNYIGSTVLEDDTINQEIDWQDNILHFDIGTIKLNQVWQATYTLTMLKEGQIKIFDSDSKITFNNGQTLTLPDTYMTVLSPDGTGITNAELHITNLRVTTPDPINTDATIEWDLAYTGRGSILEKIERSADGGIIWSPLINRDQAGTTTHDSYWMNLLGDLPGDYLIRVTVHAPDAPDDSAQTTMTISNIPKTPKIKIG